MKHLKQIDVVRVCALLIIIVLLFVIKETITANIEAKLIMEQFSAGGTANLTHYMRLNTISDLMCWCGAVFTFICLVFDIYNARKKEKNNEKK